jgi:transcriptional regulator with XRE-family HTH domain
MKISTKIKKIRELKDIPQKSMAEELKLSIAGYGKIERGEVEVTLSKLEIIASVFKVAPNFIVDFNVETYLNSYLECKNLNKLIEELKNTNNLLLEENSKLWSVITPSPPLTKIPR